MSMTTKSADSDVMAELNVTPLIDVMLVLLVLLLITLPIQTHAVKIDLGTHLGMPQPPPAIVNIGVAFDGAVLWNGQVVNHETLDRRLTQATQQSPQPEIHITADRLARYDTVAKVLSDAQRLGVKTMGIVNTNQYIR